MHNTITPTTRSSVNAKFNTLLSKWKQMSAAGFRRAVITYAMELAGCTFAAAATHYIYALHMAIKANPDSVEGLYYKEGDPLSTYVLY